MDEQPKPTFGEGMIHDLSQLADTLEIMLDPDFGRMFAQSRVDVREGRLHDHDDVEMELS